MARGQTLGFMFMIGLVVAIVFGVLYLLIGGLDGPRSSGLRPEIAGHLQACALSTSECSLVRLGEFGGRIAFPNDGFEKIGMSAGTYLARNSLSCVGSQANISSESRGSFSFNEEDTTSMLLVPSGYSVRSESSGEEGRFDRFSSAVDARYKTVRNLESAERDTPGRLDNNDLNLDFLSTIAGSAIVYEG